MKKKTFWKRVWVGLLAFLICLGLLPVGMETAYAKANSYTNAKEFYNSTGQVNGTHALRMG